MFVIVPPKSPSSMLNVPSLLCSLTKSSFSTLSLSILFLNRNSLHRRLLDGSPRMSTLNTTSPNDSQSVVDGPMSLGSSTNGESSLLPSLVLRRPTSNMFVAEPFLAFVDFTSSNICLVSSFMLLFCDVTDDLLLFLFWTAWRFSVELHFRLCVNLLNSWHFLCFQKPKFGFDTDEWDGIARQNESSGGAA